MIKNNYKKEVRRRAGAQHNLREQQSFQFDRFVNHLLQNQRRLLLVRHQQQHQTYQLDRKAI